MSMHIQMSHASRFEGMVTSSIVAEQIMFLSTVNAALLRGRADSIQPYVNLSFNELQCPANIYIYIYIHVYV